MVDLVWYGVELVQDLIKSINLRVQSFEKKEKMLVQYLSPAFRRSFNFILLFLILWVWIVLAICGSSEVLTLRRHHFVVVLLTLASSQISGVLLQRVMRLLTVTNSQNITVHFALVNGWVACLLTCILLCFKW